MNTTNPELHPEWEKRQKEIYDPNKVPPRISKAINEWQDDIDSPF